MNATEWIHKNCRSAKKDGAPVFDGRKWVCSRCGSGYVVADSGCSQGVADKFFDTYLAGIGFTVNLAILEG